MLDGATMLQISTAGTQQLANLPCQPVDFEYIGIALQDCHGARKSLVR